MLVHMSPRALRAAAYIAPGVVMIAPDDDWSNAVKLYPSAEDADRSGVINYTVFNTGDIHIAHQDGRTTILRYAAWREDLGELQAERRWEERNADV